MGSDDQSRPKGQLAAKDRLVAGLRSICGRKNVLTERRAIKRFRTGFRCGEGAVTAVVQPHSLVAMWRSLQTCIDADAIVIMQAANTGLTGGSTPLGTDYDRSVIIINPMSVDAIHVIDEGRQVICLPGATLNALEDKLRAYGREPHSVIGSSCIGASVMGGICNNSGGALARRGPAYTELALYAQLGADRRLRLINHIGVNIDGEPEVLLDRIERGSFSQADIIYDPDRQASARVG